MAAKFVVDYQPTDEQGNPVGKPTHLEADTPEEMFDKQKTAHISAVQALARQNKAFNDLKARKVTPVVPPPTKPVFTPEQEKIRKSIGVEELEARVAAADAARAHAQGEAQAFQFMRAHLHDFFPCEANSAAMKQFLIDNNLEFTVDNLEIAFATIGNDLAKDPKWSTAGNANNNNSEEQEDKTVQPLEPQQQRTSFGMQPGTTSGRRPTGKLTDGRMTKKDVIALVKNNPAEYKKRLRDPKLRAEMDAALQRA